MTSLPLSGEVWVRVPYTAPTKKPEAIASGFFVAVVFGMRSSVQVAK